MNFRKANWTVSRLVRKSSKEYDTNESLSPVVVCHAFRAGTSCNSSFLKRDQCFFLSLTLNLTVSSILKLGVTFLFPALCTLPSKVCNLISTFIILNILKSSFLHSPFSAKIAFSNGSLTPLSWNYIYHIYGFAF